MKDYRKRQKEEHVGLLWMEYLRRQEQTSKMILWIQFYCCNV